jgi:hypothetical protein
MFNPGEIDVGTELAAFWTATTVGVVAAAPVTVIVTGRLIGELGEPATEIETVPL